MSNEVTLDEIDGAIIANLIEDGRMSNVQLAANVGLTPAPCLRRVKRLEDEGVITGYRAKIDPAAAGRPFCVLMSVEITMSDRQTVDEFEASVAAFEEVTEIRRLFGIPDYIIRVDVADGSEYERFQSQKMAPLPAVHRIVSHLTMKVIKSMD